MRIQPYNNKLGKYLYVNVYLRKRCFELDADNNAPKKRTVKFAHNVVITDIIEENVYHTLKNA